MRQVGVVRMPHGHAAQHQRKQRHLMGRARLGQHLLEVGQHSVGLNAHALGDVIAAQAMSKPGGHARFGMGQAKQLTQALHAGLFDGGIAHRDPHPAGLVVRFTTQGEWMPTARAVECQGANLAAQRLIQGLVERGLALGADQSVSMDLQKALGAIEQCARLSIQGAYFQSLIQVQTSP